MTRPAEAAQATAGLLEELGHTVTLAPLLAVEPVETPMPDGDFDCVILTSANAAHRFVEVWSAAQSVLIVVTGSATAACVRTAGFTNCHSVDGSALDVLAHITSIKPKLTHILYPRAESVAHDLGLALRQADIRCADWVVYRTTEADKLDQKVQDDLSSGAIGAALLYSPRTARVFARLVGGALADEVSLFALSGDVAAALGDELQTRCRFPSKPTQDALFDLLATKDG
ncbi:uroporphyrinogen-III synthase [Pseudahrensia aquimaris]|uniref:Uroporphyrinogen-III synthase n=1 Tax=Pseudahrensia aquimaris TaxID=744461 RepID=A0ABW3FE07_9HYPH